MTEPETVLVPRPTPQILEDAQDFIRGWLLEFDTGDLHKADAEAALKWLQSVAQIVDPAA